MSAEEKNPMADFFESESFVSPSEVRNDVANRLKHPRSVKGLELCFKGDSLQNTKEFARQILLLRRQGVKVSHDFSIKLSFPRAASREKILTLVEQMPKPTNGLLKVRVHSSDPAATATVTKA